MRFCSSGWSNFLLWSISNRIRTRVLQYHYCCHWLKVPCKLTPLSYQSNDWLTRLLTVEHRRPSPSRADRLGRPPMKSGRSNKRPMRVVPNGPTSQFALLPVEESRPTLLVRCKIHLLMILPTGIRKIHAVRFTCSCVHSGISWKRSKDNMKASFLCEWGGVFIIH